MMAISNPATTSVCLVQNENKETINHSQVANGDPTISRVSWVMNYVYILTLFSDSWPSAMSFLSYKTTPDVRATQDPGLSA